MKLQETLLLNATYEPLRIVSWKKAVRMLFQEKVEVVEVYDRPIRSPSLTLQMPAVIRLVHYVKIRRYHTRIKFSRANVFARDRYRCQYCKRRFPPHELTCDHVLPVARGGEKNWENIVTSCHQCNRRKGNRTPEEAGLVLHTVPRAPAGFPARVHLLLAKTQTPQSWDHYIFLARDQAFEQG